MKHKLANSFCRVEIVGKADCLWRYIIKPGGRAFNIAAPVFEVNGASTIAVLKQVRAAGKPTTLSNGVVEHVFCGDFAKNPNLALTMVFRIAPDNPVVRCQYRLSADKKVLLTKRSGADNLRYLAVSLAGLPECKEVQFSEFDDYAHTFHLSEHPVGEAAFTNALNFMGPMLVAGDGRMRMLVAYEHGSMAPNAFLQYQLAPGRGVSLHAVKGNYFAGRVVDCTRPYETIWLEFAAVQGDEEALAHHFRSFVLKRMTLNAATRKPAIFYNTWNYQERNKWWHGNKYLDSMNEKRMLAEIDVAYRMGVEVFVLDTGWYEKTGDWLVNKKFFPRGLKPIKQRLNKYGMQLGLWFSPSQAAISSRLAKAHGDCRISVNGKLPKPVPVWETEESLRMCLVSRYWDAFADEMIRLSKELGVTYFKWDAIQQTGQNGSGQWAACDDAGHAHGTKSNALDERRDCYAFEQVRYMLKIVDKVCAACPDAIVDFDITEGLRSVGLAFLAGGKYFVMNNGPYYPSFDDPVLAPGGGLGCNVFVFPGPARARVMRVPLDFDKWIPSVLFLGHYLPDDPESSQLINLASLVLGQNGIWGDLLKVSPKGVALFGKVLKLYKQVRADITASDPVRIGNTGGSPEIHEKISGAGRGVVAAFASTRGSFNYVTAHRAAKSYWASEGVEVRFDKAGRARLDMSFDKAGAKLIFFGVKS